MKKEGSYTIYKKADDECNWVTINNKQICIKHGDPEQFDTNTIRA